MAALVGTIQVRKDTAANWTSNNPTLLNGEMGFETDTKKIKVGDGATLWNALAYITTWGPSLAGYIQDGDTLSNGLVFPNTGFRMLDQGGDHAFRIVPAEDYTGDRRLNIILNDVTKTLTIPADASVSGTNTGDETAQRIGDLINAATSKTTPVDADQVGLMDSAAGNILKKLSWANVKATLKTYFDTLYQTIITFGTGVQTALGVNVGTAGSIVVNGGALGTPSSGTLTSATGLPIDGGTTGTLPITRGGTGGTTISGAHTNLEIYNSMRVLLGQAATLTNQPNSLEILSPASPGIFVSRVDLTNFTEVMLQVHVFVSSASGNSPRVILGYSTTYTTTAGSFSDIGTSAVTCSMSSAGVIQSGWVALAAGAKANIYIAGLTNGGNGAADPQIQGVTAFFR